MRFLTENDYLPYIKADNLTVIHQNNPSLLEDIEAVAIQKIIQFTSAANFDSSCLFPTLLNYNSATAYSAGSYIYDSATNKVYVAETDISAPNVITDFTESDPRNGLIKQWLIDIILYDIHSRISPNQIPTLRVDRYRDTMMNLKELSKGLFGGLPESCRNVDSDDNIITNWGSETKKNNYY